MEPGKQPICRIHRLGEVPYRQAWDLQARLAAEVAAGGRPPTLLLLEHPHTYTFGRSGEQGNLLWDREEVEAREVEIHWVDRGGDVTYHGPGQLVGYPILPLGRVASGGRLPKADYVGYIRRLEAVLIRTLAGLGLVTGQIPGKTGVWIQPDVASRCPRCPPSARRAPSKLASIGVKVDARGVSRHGFALNVAPDMSYWEGIVACGLEGRLAVSLEQLLDPAPSFDEVSKRVAEAFGRVFDYEMQLGEPLEPLLQKIQAEI